MMYNIFENSSTISICVMEEFHDYTMLFLIMIFSFISTAIIKILNTKNTNYNFKENMNLELIWTILPIFILFFIAYPSLYYLYLFDLSVEPVISIKVIGAQWYWIYEYLTEKKMGWSFSSYMLSDLELMNGKKYKMGWRLLETDSRMIIPCLCEIQCITTSMDVIHSFSIPGMGIKIDAIPGRLNSVNFFVTLPGIFYGQCAEICGTGHSFMPICIEAI